MQAKVKNKVVAVRPKNLSFIGKMEPVEQAFFIDFEFYIPGMVNPWCSAKDYLDAFIIATEFLRSRGELEE